MCFSQNNFLSTTLHSCLRAFPTVLPSFSRYLYCSLFPFSSLNKCHLLGEAISNHPAKKHTKIIIPPLISNLDFQLHFEGHEIRLDYPCTPADNDLLESGWLLPRTELVLSSFQQVPGTPLVSRPTPLTHITCLAAELCHSISREGRKQRKQESASHCFIPRKVFCI